MMNEGEKTEQKPDVDVGSSDLVAPCAVPLLERLRCPDIPGAISIEIEEYHHRNIPVGYLCKEAADRIEELEAAIRLASDKFFTDGSDMSAAAAMMRILKDVEIPPGATM